MSAEVETVPPAPPLVPAPAEGREYLTAAEVAAAYEVDKMTVNRWLTIGVTAWDGAGHKRRVILRGRKLGGRWKITPAALAEFVREIGHRPEAQPVETPTEKQKRVDACLAKLAAQGLL